MEGINKLRAMTMWYNEQSEYITDGLSFKQLEKIFDYSVINDLAYVDNDYLYSGEVTEKERIKYYKFLTKLKGI